MSTDTLAPASLFAQSAAPAPATHAAIARAAERTGADFSYLLAQARLESGLDPQARARTSSAAGLYQFIDSTWLATLDRHAASFGMGGIAQAIESTGGRARVADPAMRGSIMALRFDPQTSALMAGALAQDNRAALAPVLGREPDAAELYLAHFLGAAGATRFLTALAASPDTPAASLLPAAAAANRPIFHAPSGAARSLAEVMDVIRAKMAGAMDGGGAAPSALTGAHHFAAARAQWQTAGSRASSAMLSLEDRPARPAAMSETLRSSFALRSAEQRFAASEHVHSAYGKLKALGL